MISQELYHQHERIFMVQVDEGGWEEVPKDKVDGNSVDLSYLRERMPEPPPPPIEDSDCDGCDLQGSPLCDMAHHFETSIQIELMEITYSRN